MAFVLLFAFLPICSALTRARISQPRESNPGPYILDETLSLLCEESGPTLICGANQDAELRLNWTKTEGCAIYIRELRATLTSVQCSRRFRGQFIDDIYFDISFWTDDVPTAAVLPQWMIQCIFYTCFILAAGMAIMIVVKSARHRRAYAFMDEEGGVVVDSRGRVFVAQPFVIVHKSDRVPFNSKSILEF